MDLDLLDVVDGVLQICGELQCLWARKVELNEQENKNCSKSLSNQLA